MKLAYIIVSADCIILSMVVRWYHFAYLINNFVGGITVRILIAFRLSWFSIKCEMYAHYYVHMYPRYELTIDLVVFTH